MNKQDIKISIVIPIYNAEKQLRRCIDSVVDQTLKEYEVIMVDDGSSDNSSEICREYCENNSRFKYIYQSNSGPDISRKAGTNVAKGEYIAYVDADDIIRNDLLEKLFYAAQTTNADIVCAQIVRFNEKKEWSGSVLVDDVTILNNKKEIIEAFFETGVLIGTYYAKLIKRSLMVDYEFIKDGYIGEDITAALYMFEKASMIAIIPDQLYYYYQNPNSISHAKYSKKHEVSLNNYIKIRDYYIDVGVVCRERVCGYFAGYQMAVATAMGRNGKYELEAGKTLRNDLREHWVYIKHDDKTAIYMKICILMFMYAPRLFVKLFRILYLMTGR